MHAKAKLPLAAVLLAAALAVPAPSRAADPAPVTDETVTGVASPDTTPRCGNEQVRLRLYGNHTDEHDADGVQLCRHALEAVGSNGQVLSSVTLPGRSCSSHHLVCDSTGGGIVAFADTYEVTSWGLQAFAADGTLLGAPRQIIPVSNCKIPSFWSLAVSGDLVMLDDCWTQAAGSAVALRRFPVGADVEPEPIWIKEATPQWRTSTMAAATDGLGNMLVAWTESYNEQDNGEADQKVMARGVGADGALLGEAFRIDTFAPPRTGLIGVVVESDGIFSIYTWNWFAGGMLVRTVSIDPDLFTTATTTTTTLPPSPQAPVFDLLRSVGQAPAASDYSPMFEGSLASMKGDGNGTLLLRRWVVPGPVLPGYYSEPDRLEATAYRSENAGLRWSRADSAPQPTEYQHTPPWDAASPNGTLLAAAQAWREFPSDDWPATGVVLAVRRSADHGKTWSDEVPITGRLCWNCQEFFVHDVSMASDGHGNWIAAWVTSRETNGGHPSTWRSVVEASWSFDDGRTWTQTAQVWELAADVFSYSEDTQLRQLLTAVAGSDGSWGLAWRSENDGTVRVAHAPSAMSPWEVSVTRPPFEKPAEVDLGEWWDPAKPYSRPALVATPLGAWILAWEEKHAAAEYRDDGDIFYVRSGDNGRSWSQPSALNAYALIDGARDSDPSLASDAAGRILAVWASHDPLGSPLNFDSDVVSSISVDSGLTWSPPAEVDPAFAFDARHDVAPLVVSSGDSGWTVVWTSLPFLDESRWRRWAHEDAVVRVAVSGSRCGNGTVDTGEECDDANDVDGDGCNSNCTLAGCRNEVVDPGEACDYDDPVGGLACNTNCELPVCGDGERNIWTEPCDDGNTADDDLCPTTCRQATCGDGFVFPELEECDDANTNNDDACNNFCDIAYCGDGAVRPGVEQCDDGDGWGGNSCTDQCRPAVCGDGRVWLGVEQCDDPDDSVHHGNCTDDCRLLEGCSDADASGTTTSSDALTILRDAVDLGDVCTPERCDVNGSGATTAIDASGALRIAAGLHVSLQCPLAGLASFMLDASPLLGALQFSVAPGSSDLAFGLGDGKDHCQPRVPGTMFASGPGAPGQLLMVGVLSLNGFRGPIELARCPIYARRDQPPGTGSVEIRIDDASDLDGNPVSGEVSVRMISH